MLFGVYVVAIVRTRVQCCLVCTLLLLLGQEYSVVWCVLHCYCQDKSTMLFGVCFVAIVRTRVQCCLVCTSLLLLGQEYSVVRLC